MKSVARRTIAIARQNAVFAIGVKVLVIGSGMALLWVEGLMLVTFSVIMFRLAVSKVKGKLA